MIDHLTLFTLPLLFAVAAFLIGLTTNKAHIETIRRTASALTLTWLVGLVSYHWLIQHMTDVSPLRLTLTVMVTLLGWSLLRFSKAYMAGELNLGYYYRWLMATLAGVLFTISSSHLASLWLGWVAISLSLHQLLTFYPERPRALLAAHKKFILARIAETTLATAFALLYFIHGHGDMAKLATYYQSSTQLTALEEWIVALLCLTAIIKSAQLPVHGWLIKVVEAPTPVSALLHAGVINLGGILLLLFAPLMSLSNYAVWLLIVTSLFTVILSALIMTTRISVKVRLAWSTSAQMGLMLLEIALGLYHIALLHLIGHSCYKAYQFLMSGSAVNHNTIERMQPLGQLTLNRIIIAMLAMLLPTVWLATVLSPEGLIAPWVLLALAISGLILFGQRSNTSTTLFRTLLVGICIVLSYLLSSAAAEHVITQHFVQMTGQIVQPATHAQWADILTSIGFIGLFFTATALVSLAHRPWVRKLSQLLFAGLYLDEWFTRQTLKLWPTDLQRGQASSNDTPCNSLSAQEQ